jgi:DNA polymerase III subunit delta
MPAQKTTTEPKAYLFRGDGDYQKAQALKELLAGIVSPDFADFDLEELEGNTATTDRVMAGLNVPPFGSPRRVVLMRYANKMDKDEQKLLAEKLPSGPDAGLLVLHTPAADKVDGKPKAGSDVVGELSKAVRKVGKVWEMAPLKGAGGIAEVKRYAQGLVSEAGCKIDPDALELLHVRVGFDFNVIGTEVEKLVRYVGDEERITKSVVAEVTSETPEEKVFALVDAIGARNQALALRLLENVFEYGGDPRGEAPRVLALICRQMRLIWQVRTLQESGVRGMSRDSVPGDVAEMLPSSGNLLDHLATRSWTARRLIEQAALFTFPQLTQCFEEIELADLLLKGVEPGPDDPRMIMDLLVVKLASVGKPQRR